MPLILERRVLGDVLFYPEDQSVDAKPFIELLGSRINESLRHSLEAATRADHRLTLAAINTLGLTTRFDARNVELHTQIAAEHRALNTVFLSRRGDAPQFIDALTPSSVSGFINGFAGQDFNFNVDPGTNERRPFHSELDGAINYRNWVLEGAATYVERAPYNWSRGDIRVVRDFPNALVRGAIGDLSYPVSYYQRYRPLGGVTAASNFSLQPYRVTIPMSNTEIFLNSPSRVAISVNGVRIQTVQLPAGRHDIRNLALTNGISDIRLDITDESGRTQTLIMPWVSDADLLAPNMHQFSYSAGFPSEPFHGSRKYDSQRPTASLFHRYGLSHHATIGSFFQGDKRQIIMGGEALWARSFGTITIEPAMSRISGISPAYSGRIRYTLTDYRGPDHTQRNFSLGAEYRQRGFAHLDNLVGAQTLAYDLTASYGQTLFWQINGRASVSYQFNRVNRDQRSTDNFVTDTYTTSLTFLRGFNPGIQASLSLVDRRNILGIKEQSIFGLLTWAIPGTNHYLTATSDTSRGSNRLDWRYNSARLVGGLNAGAGVEKVESVTKADANLEYIGNRGTISVTQDSQTDPHTRTSHITAVRAASSLVFAGGHFGVGRPISESFSIIAPTQGLKGQTIDVNPNGYQYYEARADWLGPGVVPNLRPYQYYHLYFDPTKLLPGYELDRENCDLLPSYKSGILVRLGTDSKLMLGGRLQGTHGQALSLESGEAFSLTDPSSPPITLFTNRKGKFRSLGFRPGRYEIRFFNEALAPVIIEIPNSVVGYYEAGNIQVTGAKQ